MTSYLLTHPLYIKTTHPKVFPSEISNKMSYKGNFYDDFEICQEFSNKISRMKYGFSKFFLNYRKEFANSLFDKQF